MKNSSAMHLLGLLLASAATASVAKPLLFPGGSHGGSGLVDHSHPHHGDDQYPSDRHFHHSHEMLERHVVGSGDAGHPAATAGEEGEAELLHPLSHYLSGFFRWTYTFGNGLTGWPSMEDAVHALKNYAKADDKIALHDAEGAGYTLAHNSYSHMSWEEFRDHFHIGSDMVVHPEKAIMRPRGERVSMPMLRGEALPDEVDWTSKGGVTDVKNQGSCGSCWSFSTTGAMEGAHFIKTGELAQFSEQELVDCDSYDMGCNGGLMDNSFHWIQQNHGICSETDYPYKAISDECQKSSCKVVPGTDVDKWIDVDHDSEEALMAAVAQQPVSIAIEADEMSFQLYSGGVLTAACGTNLDHGVLLVGYGVSEDGIKYWKVKNSWGGDWGMGGYILLKRDGSQQGGECGILEQASYPILV